MELNLEMLCKTAVIVSMHRSPSQVHRSGPSSSNNHRDGGNKVALKPLEWVPGRRFEVDRQDRFFIRHFWICRSSVNEIFNLSTEFVK